MFITFWLVWGLVGLGFATWLFAWAVKTRQFENSRKAALIPFDDIVPESNHSVKGGKGFFYMIIGLVIYGILLTVVMLVAALA